MQLAFIQLPMVLFTTLAPMASGAFIGLAIAFATAKFTDAQLARIDRWTLLPLGILAVSFLAACAFYLTPQYAITQIQGVGGGPVVFQIAMAALFAGAAVVYCALAMTRSLSERMRVIGAFIMAALALVLSLSIGVMYQLSAVTSWGSLLVPLGLMGFCAAGGVPLGMLVVSLADAMPAARTRRFATASIVVAFVGGVVAIIATSAQLLNAQGLVAAYLPGVDPLPGSWAYLAVSIAGVVIMLGCVRAALSPDRASKTPVGRTAGAAAAMPQRDLTRDGARETARSSMSLLVGANAAILVGIFVARLMFYALQL